MRFCYLGWCGRSKYALVDARQQESSLYRHEHDASGLGLVSTSASLHLTVAAVIAGVMILLVISVGIVTLGC